ncbi:MAG: hypothetical protein FWE98_01595 [Oscillospiraceae bacterium]|nr:hypothetical protein [Oscillospiraceae bacterium]
MKIKDYLLGILAGCFMVALWYGQMVLSWLNIGGGIIWLLVYPVIPAILLVRLLKHGQFKYYYVKFGLYLVSAVCFHVLCLRLNLPDALLNAVFPGYGEMSAGGGFAIMVMAGINLVYKCVAILLTGFVCWLKYDSVSQPAEHASVD